MSFYENRARYNEAIEAKNKRRLLFWRLMITISIFAMMTPFWMMTHWGDLIVFNRVIDPLFLFGVFCGLFVFWVDKMQTMTEEWRKLGLI